MDNHAPNTFQQRRQIFGDAFSSSSSSSGGSVRLLNQRKLAKLEHDANATPHDPRKQAELYKVSIWNHTIGLVPSKAITHNTAILRN
jgi:hypothetical protein